jgi:hypothetical protein
MEVNGQLYALAASPPGERVPGTRWIGGWVGPRAGLGALGKRNSFTAGNRIRVVQLVARRYTDWCFSCLYLLPWHGMESVTIADEFILKGLC